MWNTVENCNDLLLKESSVMGVIGENKFNSFKLLFLEKLTALLRGLVIFIRTGKVEQCSNI